MQGRLWQLSVAPLPCFGWGTRSATLATDEYGSVWYWLPDETPWQLREPILLTPWVLCFQLQCQRQQRWYWLGLGRLSATDFRRLRRIVLNWRAQQR